MIHIRPASESDLSRLCELYNALETPGASVSRERVADVFAQTAALRGYTVYVAEENERVTGTFALLIFPALGARCRPVGVVEDVVVDPALRGRGVGKAMMEFARARCREKGCYKMMLSSNERRETAHRFYESLGFERHGISFTIEP